MYQTIYKDIIHAVRMKQFIKQSVLLHCKGRENR
jgi:hypothetical protein